MNRSTDYEYPFSQLVGFENEASTKKGYKEQLGDRAGHQCEESTNPEPCLGPVKPAASGFLIVVSLYVPYIRPEHGMLFVPKVDPKPANS